MAQQAIVVPFGPAPTGQWPKASGGGTGQGAPAAWSVVDDPSVQAGRVLAQIQQRDQTDYRFPLAIYERVNAGMSRSTVRFKAVAGRVDRAGGIAVRLADADNYYVLRANALEDNVSFYRSARARRQIHGASAKVASERWHTLSLKADGDQFTIGSTARRCSRVTDQTFAMPARWRCGRRPTASHASMIWRYGRCHKRGMRAL